MTESNYQTVVLPEYIPDNLGAPFEVVLKNSVRQLIDKDTGEVKKTTIPNPRGLLQRVAITRLVYPRRLSGGEIKFVRKSLSIKAGDLADMIGVSPEHLSRCEAGERVLSTGVEKCLRMAVILEVFLKIPEETEKVCEEDSELRGRLDRYKDALCKLRKVIKGINIQAAYDVDEKLCFSFHVVKSEVSQSPLDPSEEEDWADEQALAA